MEAALLAHWRREIAAGLNARYGATAARLGHEELMAQVDHAMAAARAVGGAEFDELRDVTEALFVASHVDRDEGALIDLTAMLLAEEPFAAQLAQLRNCVPAMTT